MIVKTDGIVVNYIRYRESSIIVRIYTFEKGFQSFIVSGVRNPKAKISIGLFQPLNQLELVANWSRKGDLHRLTEAKIKVPTPSFQLNASKSAMVMFISELVSKTLSHEHYQNEELFEFLSGSIQLLDLMGYGFESFHIHFMIRYPKFLGFEVQSIWDMLTEIDDTDDQCHQYIATLMSQTGYESVETTGVVRSQALDVVTKYYQRHIDHFGELKSLNVLRQVFH